MRFLFLIHGDSEAEAVLRPDERRAIVAEHMTYAAMLRERGAYVLGDALTGETATVRPGDKPFVDCDGRDDALDLAARVPASPGLAVEVLTIVTM